MKGSQTFERCQDVLQLPLTETDFTGRMAQGQHYSYGVSKWFLSHHNPKIPTWSLDIEAFYSLPIFGTNPLRPRTFSVLLRYGVLSLPLDWRQLSCLIHLCEPTVFHDGALLVNSLLLLLPPYYIWKNTHLTRQISPPTIKPGMPHSLCPSLPCSYGEHECPRPNQPNSPATECELEAVTWGMRNHTESIVKGVVGKTPYLVSRGSIRKLASGPAGRMGSLPRASFPMSFQGLLLAYGLKLILVSQRFSEPANVT